MRPIRLTIKLLYIILAGALLCSCGGDDLEGTYYLSDEAREYMIDTTVTSFRMVDNHGLTDEFYLDGYIWYTLHHYFSEWGTEGDAFGETFGVAYMSSVNDYSFMFVLRANVGYTELDVEWNQRDRLTYNFKSGKVTYGVVPGIMFYDTMSVKGITYSNIIEIDYSGRVTEIDDNTPVKTYISGEKGLIKFIRKDNIVFERIE